MFKIIIIALTFVSSYNLRAFEPQSVLLCGGKNLIEYELGKYFILPQESYGPSKPIYIDLAVEKVGKNCEILLTRSDYPIEKRKLYFSTDGDGLVGRTSVDAEIDSDCKISPRYKDSLGECRLPVGTDPRDKCHDLPGRPLQVELRGTTFSSWVTADKNNRIDLFSGGAMMTTYEGKEAVELLYINIWKENLDWCVYKTKYSTDRSGKCTKFEGNYELKNKNGEIIGLIQNQGEDIIFRQVKMPLSKTSAEIDDTKEILKLSAKDKVTTIAAFSKDGGSIKDGIAKVVGAFEKTDRDSKVAPPFALGTGKSRTSDCNGLYTFESSAENVPNAQAQK